jgi:CHAD domain-containing protein
VDPARAEPVRVELGWLGSSLGAVRDLDVMIEHLEQVLEQLPDRAQAAPVVAELESERDAARADLLAALDSDRYLALLDRLEELVCSSPQPGGPSLREIAAGEYRKVRKAAKILDDLPSDDELHALRIKAKRLRYAAELAQQSMGKPAARVVEAAKTLQDVIGEHQDSVVAEERIRSIAARLGDPDVSFGAGVLVERQRARRAGARAEVPVAWTELDELARKAFA